MYFQKTMVGTFFANCTITCYDPVMIVFVNFEKKKTFDPPFCRPKGSPFHTFLPHPLLEERP